MAHLLKRKAGIAAAGIMGTRLLTSAVLIVTCLVQPPIVFGCDDVTSITWYIADSQPEAEQHPTAALVQCLGDSGFIWHAHWVADGPDYQDFQWQVFIDGTLAESFFPEDGELRSGTHTSSIPGSIEAGTYTAKLRMKRYGGEWCWSNGRTLHVVNVENVTFSPTALCCDGSSTSTASATISPSSRTITWSIQEPPLGCSIDPNTGVITAGTTAETITVRAADSVRSACYEDGQIDVVKVDWIQYDDPDNGWTNIQPFTCCPLYVRKGTTVTFKATPEPSGASWPSGKPVWGGTAGASGTGSTESVTFNTLSSSTSDYKTVTAECGNTVTIYVVVFEFEGVFTPEDNFSGRSTMNYGLEEKVALDFETDPWSVTAGQAGGLEWTHLSGVGTVSNAGSDGKADYDAGETDGVVGLRITIKSGPSKDEFESYGKTVVKPSGTRMTRVNTNVWHVQWYASAGIQLYYWLDPKNVSFKYLTFGEGSCPSTNVSGFYLACEPWSGSGTPPTNSYPNGTQQAGHAQNSFGAILGGNSTTGCRVQSSDYSSTGAAIPWAAGSYTYVIPSEYIDDTASRHSFGSQTKVATYDSSGGATNAKGGESGSAARNAPTSSY